MVMRVIILVVLSSLLISAKVQNYLSGLFGELSANRCLGSGSWDKYSHNLLKASYIKKGIAYMKRHRKTLDRAYKRYGVPPQYITAIIGLGQFMPSNYKSLAVDFNNDGA
jgi:membrane-bound lytic murein transglycosylase B